jgi:hypothetical protein
VNDDRSFLLIAESAHPIGAALVCKAQRAPFVSHRKAL